MRRVDPAPRKTAYLVACRAEIVHAQLRNGAVRVRQAAHGAAHRRVRRLAALLLLLLLLAALLKLAALLHGRVVGLAARHRLAALLLLLAALLAKGHAAVHGHALVEFGLLHARAQRVEMMRAGTEWRFAAVTLLLVMLAFFAALLLPCVLAAGTMNRIASRDVPGEMAALFDSVADEASYLRAASSPHRHYGLLEGRAVGLDGEIVERLRVLNATTTHWWHMEEHIGRFSCGYPDFPSCDDRVVVVRPQEGDAFHHAYYVYVPDSLPRDGPATLLVVPTNGGMSDSADEWELHVRFEVQELRAVAEDRYARISVSRSRTTMTDWPWPVCAAPPRPAA